MPINYDKIDRESLEKWAAFQIEVQSDNNHDSELSRNHDVPPLYPEPETENFGPGM
jgi:hypothetical protein